MKTSLLSLLLISFLSNFAQDSCVVKIFPGDCRNCYIGIEKVELSDEGIKKTIVLPNLSQAEVHAYLNNVLNIDDISKFSVIVSDSIYNSINNSLTSEIYIYNDNKLNNQLLLKKFYGFEELGSYEIRIPDTIAISVEATIINHEDYFFITDSKFGNYIFINKHGDHKVTVLGAQDLTSESNFNKISGDTICYYMFTRYREILKNANMDRMQFNHTFGKRHMSAFIMAPDIKVINNEAGLTYQAGIIIFNNPKKYTILSIDAASLPENYIVYPGFYTEYKGDYYIQLAHTNRTIDDQYVLGKFILKDEKLVFSEYPEYKVPLEYLPASKFKSLRKVLTSANPYVFLQYSLSYYNMDSDQTNILPLDSVNLEFEFPNQAVNSMKFEYDYKFIDSYLSENIIHILHKVSEKYYIAYINRNDNRLIKNLEIENPEKKLKTGMSFYAADKLFYLTSDNTIVVKNIN